MLLPRVSYCASYILSSGQNHFNATFILLENSVSGMNPGVVLLISLILALGVYNVEGTGNIWMALDFFSHSDRRLRWSVELLCVEWSRV